MTILLGCIADDFTGTTDLANNLVRAGMRVVQTSGMPAGPLVSSKRTADATPKVRAIQSSGKRPD